MAFTLTALPYAFDALEPNRAIVAANADTILALAQRRTADEAQGMTDLFGGNGKPPELVLRGSDTWSPMERLCCPGFAYRPRSS